MSMPWKHFCLAALSAALLAGCQSSSTLESSGLDLQCQSPRPEICTFDYRPVCALLKSGEWQTAGNGCSACSNPEVVGYRAGACE